MFQSSKFYIILQIDFTKLGKTNDMKLVRPKKFLGQHFLKDLNVAKAIADTVDACPNLPILEVGPGMGVLTQFLLPKDRVTKVVEIDFESVAFLREHFPQLEDNIIEDDFLKMHLENTFKGESFVLTGNYPYNISSQIFFKMLEYRHLIPCCTGMIQKEVAERLAAKPCCKDYGILSVLVQLWYDVEYLFTVEPGVFNPPPKVKSAVIRMTRNNKTDCGCNERLMRRLVKTTFNQRRKMMRGSIKPLLAQIDNENGQQRDHSDFLSLPVLTRRPEQLSVQDFIDLTNVLEKHMK
jgi:16S rRNA (adenine1518-N6/adenine1519-N6)-dimethyltransferase